MSKFTDRLWREIVREHGAELRGLERPPIRPHHRAKRALAGTGLLGVAAAGAALAVVLGTAGTTPAFAVTRNHDGTYSVGIRAWSAIPAANARLRALGLRARLVAVDSGCSSVRREILPRRVVVPALARAQALVAAARIDPMKIPPGRMLVVPAIHAGHAIRLVPPKAVAGAVPSCLRPPNLVCFAAPGAGMSTTGTGTSTTSTTGTSTSSTGTTTTGTGTTTTGTGTTTTPSGSKGSPAPLQVATHCFAPPPPIFCRVDRTSGSAGTGTGTGTATTGTTTTGTTTTGATTTGATTTGTTATATTTTGTTSTSTSTSTGTSTTGTAGGGVQVPLPGRARICPGPPPPPCTPSASAMKLKPTAVAVAPGKIAVIRAQMAKQMAKQMAAVRARVAANRLQKATAGRVQVPLPANVKQVKPGGLTIDMSCGPLGGP